MKLSIIIVSFNAKKYLQECLESINKNVSSSISYEIIVVDNASSDGSAEMVKKVFPKITLVENENEGFAKANNKGVSIAKGEYLLFLNPDTIVYKKTIEGMYDFMQDHKDCGAATCRVVMANGQLDYASHRGFPTPWNSFCYFSGLTKLFPHTRFFSGYTMGYKDVHTIHKIDALAGAFMFTRREAGEAVNWWDADYFFNGEDIDFCYRLTEKKWRIYYVPTYSILHYAGISGGTKEHSQELTTANRETKIRTQKTRFNAMRLFYTKHYKKKYPLFLTWLVFKAIDYKEKKVLQQFI